jgi:Transglycosylase SLT domain
MIKRFIFCLALCFSASSFAANWELFSTSTGGDKSFTDYSRIKKDPYGIETFTAWWQLKASSAGTVNGKKFMTVLYLYRVDCKKASTAQLSANFYDASGKVIHVDEREYRPSIATPDSTGEVFVETICSAGNALAKPTNKAPGISDTVSENSLSNPVKILLPTSEPPVPEFADTESRLVYLNWLAAMSDRLAAAIPDLKLRKEFLQTVWYESNRAGLDTALIMGLIDTVSQFRKYSVRDNGARGYMAVVPSWSRRIGDGDISKLFSLQTNLRFGCAVLRHYLEKSGGDLKPALLDYGADSLSVPKTDPRALHLVERITLASERWR